jgi:hypothetical protein
MVPKKRKRIIIRETSQGFQIGLDVYPSLQKAIAQIGSNYTFVPYYKINKIRR